MKDFIKKLLRENLLDELSITDKPVYGRGMEHKLYASKSNPNILYKVGDKALVLKWSELFKSNPELFPKVYKVGALKRDPRLYYVEVEKLDTERVKKEWWLMAEKVGQVQELDDNGPFGLSSLFHRILSGHVKYEPIYHKLSGVPKVQKMFLDWVVFISTVTDYVESNGYNGLDVHEGNFAYDAGGNIKCIDV